jgi:hypothetical protein
VKVAIYCTCGDSMVGTVSPDEKAAALVQIFWKHHAGEGHGPCDAKTANRARAKAERRERGTDQ